MADYCPFLIIFRGDDTNHELNKSIRFFMTDSEYDLDGMVLHFSFLDIDKTFSDFDSERSCELVFTAEETREFPIGINFATLYLIDAEGKKHTLTTTLPVKVTLNAEEAYNGLDVPLSFPMWNIKCCCHNSSTPVGGGGGGGNGSTINIDIVPPDSNAKEGEAADAKSTYEALSRKQDSLTPKQVSAVDSGITKEKVTKLDGIEAGAQKNPDLSDYAKKSDIPSLDGYAKTADVLPRYPFVNSTIADGVVTVAPYTNAKLVSDGTPFTVAVGGESGYMRDCVLRVECGNIVPTITWPASFHPRTDAETDFKCEAGKRNVYWITEHSLNEFCVAGWQETEGGNAE